MVLQITSRAKGSHKKWQGEESSGAWCEGEKSSDAEEMQKMNVGKGLQRPTKIHFD